MNPIFLITHNGNEDNPQKNSIFVTVGKPVTYLMKVYAFILHLKSRKFRRTGINEHSFTCMIAVRSLRAFHMGVEYRLIRPRL